jgi:multicomponent Na+:H+ antiporter subunit D
MVAVSRLEDSVCVSRLFMGIGAVIYRTGIEELTKLGGLTKKMPITTATVCIAAFSISGMTFFAGYGSKGMIFEAAHSNDLIYILLELAAVGPALFFDLAGMVAVSITGGN